MTTLRQVVPGEVGRSLAEEAATLGLTVNELHNPQVRLVLAQRLDLGLVSPETWAGAEKGLQFLTWERGGRDRCTACGEYIAWATTDRDKAMPIDPLPRDDGNLRIERTARGPVVHKISARQKWTGTRYRSHFASCPFADQMRRPQASVKESTLGAAPEPRKAGDGIAISDERCEACGERMTQSLVDDGDTTHWLCGPPLTPERHLHAVPDLKED